MGNKKLWLTIVLLLVLLVTTVSFGQESELYPFDVMTSNGVYWVSYFYDGQNRGQARANWLVADPYVGGGERTWTPRREHWECLNYVIRRLKPSRGATYVIWIKYPPTNNTMETIGFTFVIEFTSSTEYIYWFSRG